MSLNWTSARAPQRRVLEGGSVRLEPLDARRHGDDLYESAQAADGTWTYLPYGPFVSRAGFISWLEERAPVDDPLTFAIVDLASGKARGLASLMSIVPEHGVIEVGHIWLSPQLQRTRQATEAIYLFARYVFDELGNRRFEWKCDSQNEGSKRAAERFGFVYEGVFRNHRVVKGRNRDTAWYSITDAEWPARKAAFEAWLAPANFDPAGRQRRSLSEIRREVQQA